MRGKLLAIVLVVATSVVVPTAAVADQGTRTLSGRVTASGGPAQGSGVALCPVGPACGDPSAWVSYFGDALGYYVAHLEAGVSYYAIGFVDGGRFRTPAPPTFIGPLQTTANFDVPMVGRTYRGTVTRTGFDSFNPPSAGAGACPQPQQPPPPGGVVCAGLVVAWANDAGEYVMRLAEGDWSVAAFVFIDGSPVIGPVQAVKVEAPFTTGEDFVPMDLSADVPPPTPGPVATLPAQGGEPLTISNTTSSGAAGGDLVSVATHPIETLTPPPPNVSFLYSTVISFTVAVTGDDTYVNITFPDPVPVNAQWYKLREGGWQVYSDVTRPDPFTLRIHLVDGGAGDDDGRKNGFITDPGAVGVGPGPSSKDGCKDGGWRNGPYRNQGDCVRRFTPAR